MIGWSPFALSQHPPSGPLLLYHIQAHPNIDDFFDDINGMLIKIIKDGSVSPERLDFLRAFFGAVRDVIIQENVRPPESVLIKQGLV